MGQHIIVLRRSRTGLVNLHHCIKTCHRTAVKVRREIRVRTTAMADGHSSGRTRGWGFGALPVSDHQPVAAPGAFRLAIIGDFGGEGTGLPHSLAYMTISTPCPDALGSISKPLSQTGSGRLRHPSASRSRSRPFVISIRLLRPATSRKSQLAEAFLKRHDGHGSCASDDRQARRPGSTPDVPASRQHVADRRTGTVMRSAGSCPSWTRRLLQQMAGRLSRP